MDFVLNIKEQMAISELSSKKEPILVWMVQDQWVKDSEIGIMRYQMDLEEISNLGLGELVSTQFSKHIYKIKF